MYLDMYTCIYMGTCVCIYIGLVYPVPEEAGLGVHATVDLGGQCRFGPDVQWMTPAQDRHLGCMHVYVYM